MVLKIITGVSNIEKHGVQKSICEHPHSSLTQITLVRSSNCNLRCRVVNFTLQVMLLRRVCTDMCTSGRKRAVFQYSCSFEISQHDH